jgi:hypothetical protein
MTAPGLVWGPCGTELPPNAKSYNQSAVPSYRVLYRISLPCGSNLLRTSVQSARRSRRHSVGSGPPPNPCSLTRPRQKRLLHLSHLAL